MARPFTLFTGQWADLPFEEVCRLASSWGYDGLEIACWGDHFEVDRALREDGYLAGRHALLDKYGLKCWAISAHLVGQAVCDHPIDERHQGILPARIWGDGEPEGVRQRAAAEIADTARAAAALGVETVVGFTGSSIWHTVAMFPPVPESMIERGYADFARPLEPDPRRVRRRGRPVRARGAPERDRLRLLDGAPRAWTRSDHRPAFGLNFDPSHFVWQDLDPVGFLGDFRDRIYHVDCKEARKRLDGRNGRLGSHLPWGDPRRGWDFVSDRPRRRAVGGRVPHAQLDRLRRPDLGRVGGRRHGPAARRARGAGVPAPVRLRAARGRLRRRVQLGKLTARRGVAAPPARPRPAGKVNFR